MRPVGSKLGRYTLNGLLGRGSGGTVYEAVLHGPHAFEKRVALKVLDVGLGEQEDRGALIQEARLGAMLAHPNVVGISELGHEDGTWYLAMDLVRGPSITQLARQVELPASAILEIGIQVCSGLAHIHGLSVNGRNVGLVHRDIKPSNLLLDRTGLVKIADLGIARLSRRPGKVAGTPGFTPPEQLAGNEDARTDLFALGATLYWLCTGHSPFGTGTRAFYAVGRVDEHLQRPEFLAPVDDVVPGLACVLRRCLCGDMDNRWPSAGVLGAELRRLLQRVPRGAALVELLAQMRDDIRPAEAIDAPVMRTTVSMATARPGELPPRVGAFFGRHAAKHLLIDHINRFSRVLSILGPGGMGKTRLALEVAHAVGPSMIGGVSFCDLTEARTVVDVCAAVGRAVGAPMDSPDPIRLGHALRARGRTLLLLDNIDRVVSAAADTVGVWAEMCPEASFLLTSRIALTMGHEASVVLEPLDAEDGLNLFIARAAIPPETDERAAAAQLVRDLDGMPLAIELAAARTHVLGTQQILQRLTDRFGVLTTNQLDGPVRHRSLRASIDSSWELLLPWEKAALAQISVFADGFSLRDAEAVLDLSQWTSAPWTLDVLAALMAHSLIQFRSKLDRFTVLQSIRAYASSQLDPIERDAAEHRHGLYFAQAGHADALRALHGHGGDARFHGMARDRENLILGCRRALQAGEVEVAVGTALAAWSVMERTGPYAVAANLLADATLCARGTARYAELAAQSARATVGSGDLDAAEYQVREALGAAREANDRRSEGTALRVLARIHRERGDGHQARICLGEARRAHRECGATHELAADRGLLGGLNMDSNHLDEAQAQYTAAAQLYRRLGSRRGLGKMVLNLGIVAFEQGRLADAAQCYEKASAIHADTGDAWLVARARCGLGVLRAVQSAYDQAIQHYRAALRLNRQVGIRDGEALCLLNLGVVYWRMGQLDRALSCHQNALTIHREIGNRRGEGVVLGNLGSLHHHLGHGDEARACFEAALRIQQVANHSRSATATWLGMAALLRDLNQLDQALEYARRAEEIARAAGNEVLIGASLGELARVRLAMDETAHASQLIDAADELLARDGLERDKLACTQIECSLAGGAHHRATAHYEALLVRLDTAAHADDPMLRLRLDQVALAMASVAA